MSLDFELRQLDLIATLPVRFVDLQRGSTPIPLFFGTLFDDCCIFLGRRLGFGSAREEEGAIEGGCGGGDGDWEGIMGLEEGNLGFFGFKVLFLF